MSSERATTNIKEKIASLINDSFKKLGLDQVNFSIDYPEYIQHGDYATNAALAASKKSGKSVQETAYEIISNIVIDKSIFEKIEISSRGFINFFLKNSFVLSQLPFISKSSYGQVDFGKNIKINLEFISANPTGPLHLGHARGAFYGDVLGNILENAGFDLIREYYINDSKQSNQIRELGKTILGMGQSYSGTYLDYKISQFKEKGFSFKGINEAEAGHLMAKSIQEDNREFIEEKLNISFDKWFSEQTLYDENLVNSMFDALKKRELIYENEGAVWITSTKFGDIRDRVVIRSSEKGGSATYYLTDMAYYLGKCEREFNTAIYILGADHYDDVKFLLILPKLFEKKTQVLAILTQMVSFKKENLAIKLSKRKGQVINLDWLLDQVGTDSARFFYLLKSPNTQMEFDVDLAKTKNLQNPVFYIQYTHARLHSILKKAKEAGFKSDQKSANLLLGEDEIALIKKLIRFPELVTDIAKTYQIHGLPHYTTDLSRKINSFYEKVRVIDEKNKNLTGARLCLIESAKNVVKKSLELMGMNAPIKM